VDTHLDEQLGFLEQFACERDGLVSVVALLLVLHLGGDHEHVGCWVINFHVLQNGVTVVGDALLADLVDHDFVHASRTHRGTRDF